MKSKSASPAAHAARAAFLAASVALVPLLRGVDTSQQANTTTREIPSAISVVDTSSSNAVVFVAKASPSDGILLSMRRDQSAGNLNLILPASPTGNLGLIVKMNNSKFTMKYGGSTRKLSASMSVYW